MFPACLSNSTVSEHSRIETVGSNPAEVIEIEVRLLAVSSGKEKTANRAACPQP